MTRDEETEVSRLNPVGDVLLRIARGSFPAAAATCAIALQVPLHYYFSLAFLGMSSSLRRAVGWCGVRGFSDLRARLAGYVVVAGRKTGVVRGVGDPISLGGSTARTDDHTEE